MRYQLVAWLEGATPDMLTKFDHKLFAPSFAARRALRTVLKNGPEVGRLLLSGERDQAVYEPDSEPSDFESRHM